MADAALTPRVRTIVICDAVFDSPIEDDVFTLEGVRQQLKAPFFPWRAALSLFLVLSSPRKGKFFGKVIIVNERTERVIRYEKFYAPIQEDNELLPIYFEVGDCVFPAAGRYRLEICFATRGGNEVLKGEYPFIVHSHEE